MPNGHEKYGECFTKDAKLIMGPNETNGRESKSRLADLSLLAAIIGNCTYKS